MVKKAKKKGKPAKKATPARGAKGAKAKAPKARTTRRRSGEQLELIKGVRFSDLDRLCREIGDNRDEINQIKAEGTDLELRALKALRLHGVTGYKNAGTYISIVPGDEKLSVKRDRLGKSSDGGADDAPVEDTGSGQDAAEISESLTDHEDVDADTGT